MDDVGLQGSVIVVADVAAPGIGVFVAADFDCVGEGYVVPEGDAGGKGNQQSQQAQ